MSRKQTVVEAEPETEKFSEPQMQVRDWPQTPPQWGPPSTMPTQPPQEPQAPSPPPAAPSQASGPATPQPLGPFPPPLGKTPTSINQILPAYPLGAQGTHFAAPIVSGPPPGSLAVAAPALLTLIIELDFSMGNFSLPIQFPTDSLLLWAALVEYQAFTTAPSASVGRTSGAADIVPVTPFAAAGAGSTVWQPATGQLPLWNAVTPQVPFQAFLNITANSANAAGSGLIVLAYARIARKWF